MLLILQMMGEFFLKFMYWMESEPAFSTLQKEVGKWLVWFIVLLSGHTQTK